MNFGRGGDYGLHLSDCQRVCVCRARCAPVGAQHAEVCVRGRSGTNIFLLKKNFVPHDDFYLDK